MEKRKLLALNNKDRYNGFTVLVLKLTGASLPNGTATSAAFTVGQDLMVGRDNGANAVTLTWNEALPAAPTMVTFTPRTDNVQVTSITFNTTTISYSTVKSDSSVTAVNDADMWIEVWIPEVSEIR